jgi:fumarylacetoacetase
MVMPKLNATHEPGRRSWVSSANAPGCDFPIQNLPFGVFRRRRTTEVLRGGIAIGDRILDLAALRGAAPLQGRAGEALAAACEPTLNRLMGMGAAHASALRGELSAMLTAGGMDESERRRKIEPLLVPAVAADIQLPAAIGDYTDFYASVFHATNVGRLLRPDNPLLPNYKWIPIAYHGRASSVVASDTAIRRPSGQIKGQNDAEPRFAPSRFLDYELEIAFFVGPGSAQGEPVEIDRAAEHIFGFCILNDWSARDIQGWEYQPLGPFLAKNFATTISPWVVTAEALAPFRTHAFARDEGDPRPLPYLSSSGDAEEGGIDMIVEAYMRTARMRQANEPPFRLSRGNFRDIYWTPAQMLAHHASGGCNLNPGDLIASGTVSGAEKTSWGSLIELTTRGKEPIHLPTGETRTFIEDGDEILMRARCERAGFVGIGFGDCFGLISGG